MEILFLGGIFPKDIEEQIFNKSIGAVFYPANKFQCNVIDGIISAGNLSLNILSAPFIGSYPFEYKDLYFKGYNTLYSEGVQCECVSFINLWGYRNISRKRSLIRKIDDFIESTSPHKTIIVYSPHTPFLQAAVYAKKKDPKIQICLIVPDLPQFMNLNKEVSFIYRFFKKVDIKIFNQNAIYIDSFVLLTESMKDIINVGDRPYLIVEGIVNSNEISYKSIEEPNNEHSIVYTGTINEKFGVVNLVKAFHAIDRDDISLKICGRGDSEDIIKEYSTLDKRIQYLGQVTNEEAIMLQKGSTILVNPRQNNGEFTKYSFPSKNMEYMLSGRPVIVYKLDGIPDEYDDYFYYVKDNTIEALRDKIIKVLNLSESERYKFGKKAQDFVLTSKNKEAVGVKILDMIKGT